MIIKVYDLKKNGVGFLREYKDLVIESNLLMGNKTLSLLVSINSRVLVMNEYYLRTNTDEYVVKVISRAQNGYRKIVAELNIEDIKGCVHTSFNTPVGGATAIECGNSALEGTGWICSSSVDERKRGLHMLNVNSYEVFQSICDAYTCEIQWDTINKIVYLKPEIGKDNEVCFTSGFNLKEINVSGESYDYFTRIIPIGADGLDISSVNNGRSYLENYQYTNKVKTLIWEDTNYTDAEALKTDAEYKLNELSKPKKTVSVKIIDFAKLMPGYSHLTFEIGDTVYVLDQESETIYEKKRITKITDYPDNPKKNTCELSNSVLSFEEMQKKIFAAKKAIDNVTNGNIVIGPKVQGMRAGQIKDLEIYSTEALTNTDIENICK